MEDMQEIYCDPDESEAKVKIMEIKQLAGDRVYVYRVIISYRLGTSGIVAGESFEIHIYKEKYL